MKKLYKRIDGMLHYHEAWTHDGKLIEHWGVVGEEGSTKEHRAPLFGKERGVEKLLRPALERGFAPLAVDELVIVLVEYVIDGFGTGNDIEKRHALEAHLNELLGWTGLSHCDGGSIGSGTMEACCVVVDADIAIRVLEAKLRETEFGDYSRIYLEDR